MLNNHSHRSLDLTKHATKTRIKYLICEKVSARKGMLIKTKQKSQVCKGVIDAFY